MCNKNLRLKSPPRSTDHYSLLKHRNTDFAFFEEGGGGGGVTLILNLIFRRGVTKILNFALKIKGW